MGSAGRHRPVDQGPAAANRLASNRKIAASGQAVAKYKNAAIRREQPAIKGNTHLLAANRWQGKRQEVIFVHGGRGAP